MTKKFLLPAILLLGYTTLSTLISSCKKDTEVTGTATVSALTCSSATFSSSATAGTAYSGTATVPYTGGNGIAYTAGTAIASTGITGLTATLQAGTLASGSGNATFSITGTPSGTGTAAFAISLGGQSCTLSLTVNASGSTTDCSSKTGYDRLLCLIDAFKATLSASQLSTVQLAYSKTDALKWSNLPQALVQTKRIGIQFGTLTAAQLAAAKAILQQATGSGANEGNAELTAILAADDYLNANGGGSTYGSGNYYMAFLGTPSTSGTWELQFGGHHFALANTYKDGKLVGATPSFRSSEPSGTFTWNNTSYQPVNQERTAFAAMLNGLSATEQTTAKLSSTFTDLVVGPGKDGQFPTTKSGIKVGTLTAAQKELVLAAIRTYVSDIDDANAATIMTKYTSELSETYIAFSGTTSMETKNDYVRIDGPSVWIEYSTQGGIVIKAENHPHSVWRDKTGDYGGN